MALIVVLQNTSELAPVSNYKYQVLVGDGSAERSRVIAAGKIEGHRRDDGWHKLVGMLLKQEGYSED